MGQDFVLPHLLIGEGRKVRLGVVGGMASAHGLVQLREA